MTYSMSVGLEVNCAYLKLSQNKIAKTQELTDFVNLDLDAEDVIVGIELLALDAAIPFDILVSDHKLSTEDSFFIQRLIPGFLRTKLIGMSEGTSISQAPQPRTLASA